MGEIVLDTLALYIFISGIVLLMAGMSVLITFFFRITERALYFVDEWKDKGE